MTSEQAYSKGYDNGFAAGEYTEGGMIEDQSNAGCDCEIGQCCEDCLTSAAFDSEMQARDFSPFEFTAHEINEDDNSEELWEEYDKGVAAGIKAAITQRLVAA